MADEIKRLAKGSITTSEVTAYTVPASTTAIVSRVTVANTSAGAIAVTVKMAGTEVIANVAVDVGGFLEWDTGHDLEAAETITVQATAAGLTYYISGVEIDV